MRVKARKHVRNEGSRQFKSAPLRQAYMDPARVQGLNCRHDLELGCSHISGLLVGHQMKPRALMDFRALRSLSVWRPRGPWLATEFGSAGPTGSPSASHNDPTQPWQERLSVPPQSLGTRNLAARALLTAGGALECRAAGVATLVER